MGRSPNLCLSFKACAGNAEDGDFSTRKEVKASPEKRRWSFRKKYAGHHVPSNTVISESLPIFSENQSREPTADTFYSEKSPSVPQKAYVIEQTSPTLQLPSPVVSSQVPKELTSTSTVLVEDKIPEHVIVIQSSIRRFLATNELQKLKNVVKLQAAARGYLVRREAAGTLRCIQAIAKMQALVRARHYVQSSDLTEKTKFDEYIQADLVKKSDMELNRTPSAIRKLVSSPFARQLLDSTPKSKSIRISCDPIKPDSAWNWLERWMNLTSMDQQEFILDKDDPEKDMKNDKAAYDVNVGLHVIPQHPSSDSELAGNSVEGPEVERDLITKSSRSTELLGLASDASLHLELDDNPGKPDYAEDIFKNGARNELVDADENEGGKVVKESRKSKNPTFAAVQAKFEELSSTPDSNRYVDYASSDAFNVSKSAHSRVDLTSKEVSERKSGYFKVEKEVNTNAKPSSHSPKDQGAASGYGTEISVSSLDRPEDSFVEIVPELRTSVEVEHGVVSVANSPLKFDETKAETNYLSNFSAVQPQRKAESSKCAAISVSLVEAVQMDEDVEDAYVDKTSLFRSPDSHATVEDSRAAPSSQISLHLRTDKAEDNIPATAKSQVAVNNSPTHLRNDSDARSSGEHLRKGTRNVKRPNSSGSDKSNHCHHEARSSCNSLPSYMQLTESAKAKVNTSFSQRSSIGLHHKDIPIKKRHSFPVDNEKHGLSPRIQSPKSQTLQVLKGNGVSSDNSTERRWQI